MFASRTTACLLLSGCFLAAFCGCRAKPAPDSGFLQHADLMKPDAKIPYNRMWVNPKYVSKNYTEIYIAPVNTDYVMAQNIWEKATAAAVNPADVKKNVQMLADYTRQAYIKAIQKDPKKKYKVVDKVGPNTLILEMAITQAVPSKAELQALGLVPFFFLGAITTGVEVGASAATHSEDQGKGVIAIEARTRDGGTGEVNSMFADREHPPTAVVDVKAIFWWEPAKPILDGWARQFVELANNPKKKAGEIPNFELLVF
ncbi:MAG TPA: DUF3313 family protein [Tepidisphaeraceae bacterium]|jgi:hypothetical protein|nr:DUF3313 family protein [Tepidisphaeraceae bacterium]